VVGGPVRYRYLALEGSSLVWKQSERIWRTADKRAGGVNKRYQTTTNHTMPCHRDEAKSVGAGVGVEGKKKVENTLMRCNGNSLHRLVEYYDGCGAGGVSQRGGSRERMKEDNVCRGTIMKLWGKAMSPLGSRSCPTHRKPPVSR